MIHYLDTSAALKLLVDEPESVALATLLDAAGEGDALVSSMLLYTELHCAGQRRSALRPASVTAVLEATHLVDVTRADLERAATSAWGLRSADAIHLAAALRIGVDCLITYDRELAGAAERVGLRVLSPS